MKPIVKTRLIEAASAKDFRGALDAAVVEMQADGLAVEVNPSMCPAQKGVGYLYSAVVVGRKA